MFKKCSFSSLLNPKFFFYLFSQRKLYVYIYIYNKDFPRNNLTFGPLAKFLCIHLFFCIHFSVYLYTSKSRRREKGIEVGKGDRGSPDENPLYEKKCCCSICSFEEEEREDSSLNYAGTEFAANFLKLKISPEGGCDVSPKDCLSQRLCTGVRVNVNEEYVGLELQG